LIGRARGGEAAALAELIESWRTYLLHIANEELEEGLKHKVGASDVVQSACMEIHEHFGEFRGESVPEWRSWLRQLLLRDLQDVRRRFRETAKRDVDRELRLVDAQGVPFDAADEDPSPRASMIANEETAALRAALQKLPEEYRQVIRLRNWDELSFAEIGARMSRSAEAARKLWSRAVEKLQTELNRITDES
jgi:RNA polymerase sigma-70 factor (ECF subfamily)